VSSLERHRNRKQILSDAPLGLIRHASAGPLRLNLRRPFLQGMESMPAFEER
jgi:hypothetical protein